MKEVKAWAATYNGRVYLGSLNVYKCDAAVWADWLKIRRERRDPTSRVVHVLVTVTPPAKAKRRKAK